MTAPTSTSGRIWRVGTLTYTLGGLAALSGWLLWGDFAWSVRDRAIPTVMQLLFLKFGASDMVAGLLFASLPSALGLIIGPLVGYNSDRLRTRWGRRIPFLVVTTPFIVLAVIALAFSPQLGGFLDHLLGRHSPGFYPSVLIVLGVFWTIFEIALVTANSVFGALVNDVVPQEVLGRVFALFRVVSLIAGILFFFWLTGLAEAHFTLIFIGVAVIYGIGFPLMCFKVKEGKYPPPARIPGGAGNFIAAVKAYFKDGFGHPYYLWFFGATLFANLATGPFNLYAVFYAKSLSMNMTNYGYCLALTYTCSLCLSYPLGMLVDRFHPLRISIAVLAVYAGVMLYGYLFVHDTRVFAIALVLHGVVSGTYFTTSASLSLRILPRAKFAEIGSAGGIINSLAGIVMAPALGMLLDHEHHDYRYTFFAGFLFTAVALVGLMILNRKFMALGGPENYVAPE